ncbi:MAG TPA: hypothetical protein VGB04_04930 [Allosphingosinicella sp.]|jgi:hypothetical protein
MTVEDRVRALEEKVKGSDRKDAWDMLSVLGGLLIPVAIFFAGQQYADAMAKAEILSEEKRAASSIDVARAGTRVSQASLVLNALETLAGTDERRKQLAIRAILIALPDEGSSIVAEVSRTDPNPQIRQFAATTLDQRRDQLVNGLCDPRGGARVAAYTALLQGSARDPALPPQLAQKARQAFADPDAPGRGDGIYNTLVLLSHLEASALAPNVEDLRRLAEEMRPVGPKVGARSDKLLERLR